MSIIMWWGGIFLLGAACFPLTNLIFRRFRSGGWMFSKVIGLFVGGYLLWMLNCLHVLQFSQQNAVVILVLMAAVSYAVRFLYKKDQPMELNMKMILTEELLFLALYLLGVYIVGFKPEAYGTEKPMDYAFLTALTRNVWMPFEDPWYAGEPINYYYGGQYLTGFLMKLSGSTAGMSYNLMRATVTAASFVLPFSLVMQMMYDKIGLEVASFRAFHKNALSVAAGVLGGAAVAFAGNGHYIVYGIILPLLKGQSYWFPDSTRYIGYDPDLPDKTIHEFPSYSSILGDLHAHYVNILFVVTVTAIVYAWAQNYLKAQKSEGELTFSTTKEKLLFAAKQWIRPEVLLIGFMTGVFRWTNFWDFPIYYVVCGSIFFFVHLMICKKDVLRFVMIMAGIAVVMFAVGTVAALPFTLTFDQISSEIGITHSHSLFYQMVILWGIPVIVLLLYVTKLVTEQKEARHLPALPDLTALLFGLCAAGLVWLPEVIYVKDIYGDEHYRANTMFKLSYQAFILFAMMMGYVLVRLLSDIGTAIVFRAASAVLLVLLVLTFGYTPTSVSAWFGNVLRPQERIHTDASVFVSEYFPDDFEAISWLNTNVTERSVILEAPGDSYSDYGRVSVATGLPTVAGWYVHEWLWRGGHEGMDERNADVEAIYTGADAENTKELLAKYRIKYLYIGGLEKEKYPNLQEELLKSLGEVVYSDENVSIVDVGDA